MTFSKYIVKDGEVFREVRHRYKLKPRTKYGNRYHVKADDGGLYLAVVVGDELVRAGKRFHIRGTRRDERGLMMYWCSGCKDYHYKQDFCKSSKATYGLRTVCKYQDRLRRKRITL